MSPSLGFCYSDPIHIFKTVCKFKDPINSESCDGVIMNMIPAQFSNLIVLLLQGGGYNDFDFFDRR